MRRPGAKGPASPERRAETPKSVRLPEFVHRLNRGIGAAIIRPFPALLQSVRLAHVRGDTYAFETIGSVPVGAPGAQLVLRTGWGRTQVTLNEEGHFPEGWTARGQPGESLVITTKAGKLVGTLTIPRGDLWWSNGREKIDLGRARIEPAGFQGYVLGDCWALASINAIAAACPEVIGQAITPSPTRPWVGVLLHDFDPKTKTYVPVSYLVDRQFSRGGVRTKMFLNSAKTPPDDRHVWLPLLEKALANRRGSYRALDAGMPASALEAITGTPARYYPRKELTTEEVKRILLEAKEQRLPVVLGGLPALIPRLVPQHAYAVTAIELLPNGGVTVKLHDPSGIFRESLNADDLLHWACSITVGGAPRDD